MSYPKLTPIIAKGATEPRYLEDRFADVVNVKDYGAIGDGTTDDIAAIKAAVQAVKNKTVEVTPTTHGRTGGPALYFPRGCYLVSEQILVSWPQLIRIVGDGAIIKAISHMDSVLKIDGAWQRGNLISGLTIDMNHVADVGIYVTGENRKIIFDCIYVTNVGRIVEENEDAPVGILLYRESGDGFSHNLKDVTIHCSSDDLVYESGYNAVGIKIYTPDINVESLSVSDAITGIELHAGNIRFTQCDVGCYIPQEHPTWENVVNIKDYNGDNFYCSLGLHTGKTGYWIEAGKKVTIGLLHYIQMTADQGSPSIISEALTPKTPIVFNVTNTSLVEVNSFDPYFWYLRKNKVIITYNRSVVGAATPIIKNRMQSGLVKISHVIGNTTCFKVVDEAFNTISNFKTDVLSTSFADNVEDGYFLLGYLLFYGSAAGVFTIALSSVSVELMVKRLGTTTYIDPTLIYGSTASSYSLCIGNSVQDSVYGFDVYPVYLKKNIGESLFSNIRVEFKAKTPTICFYRVCASSCNSLLVSNPSVLKEQAFA